MVYLWLQERRLHAKISSLENELEQRTAEIKQAQHTLNRLEGHDALTSLANHSSFQEFLRGEWRRALREASSISVMLIDIDHFSAYNDRFGHQTGDECLVKVGGKIRESARRPGDLVARYGGKAFAVVMSRTDQQGAFRVAHKICAAIEGLAIEHPDSDVSACVTVSIGVVTSTPAIDSNWEELELVTEARTALERAKKSGRNRVGTIEKEQPSTGES